MSELQARYTQIDKMLNSSFGNIVLESPLGFPRDTSNLYCVAGNDRLIWSAELPEGGALYTKMRFDEGGEKLLTYSTRGHACEVDLKTGKLLSQVLIK